MLVAICVGRGPDDQLKEKKMIKGWFTDGLYQGENKKKMAAALGPDAGVVLNDGGHKYSSLSSYP